MVREPHDTRDRKTAGRSRRRHGSRTTTKIAPRYRLIEEVLGFWVQRAVDGHDVAVRHHLCGSLVVD